MTPSVKNSRKLGSFTLCEQQWWWCFLPVELGVALGLLLLFSFEHSAFAANTPKAEGGEGVLISHITEYPTDVTNGLGCWIWTDKVADRQTCRLWREFDIPHGASVASAVMKMTADDGYQLFLDGRELGQGANWRGLTEYDLTRLLSPGHHVLAVNCFNDLYLAGMIMGLRIELSNGRTLDIKSDDHWHAVPENEPGWENLKHPRSGWPAAAVLSTTNIPLNWANNRIHWPDDYMRVPRFDPVFIPFWQTGWFHLLLAFACGLIVLVCIVLSFQLALRSKEKRLLNAERFRIARDIHDDFGTQLTRLVLESEVALSEPPEEPKIRDRFSRISDGLRDALETMDEVLWAVNPRRDTVSDFVTYVCEYAQNYLQPTTIQCLLEVEPDMPPLDFDLPLRRSLLLAVKQAITNAVKHSGATKLSLKIHRQNSGLAVVVADDGKGFIPAQTGDKRNGIRNMIQRMTEVGGRCVVISEPGKGCRVEFSIPLTRQHSRFGW